MNTAKDDTVTAEWQNFGQALGHDLWQYFLSDEFSDVTIYPSDGQEIRSHRIILAMSSGYFRDLFRRTSNANPIGECK